MTDKSVIRYVVSMQPGRPPKIQIYQYADVELANTVAVSDRDRTYHKTFDDARDWLATRVSGELQKALQTAEEARQSLSYMRAWKAPENPEDHLDLTIS